MSAEKPKVIGEVGDNTATLLSIFALCGLVAFFFHSCAEIGRECIRAGGSFDGGNCIMSEEGGSK